MDLRFGIYVLFAILLILQFGISWGAIKNDSINMVATGMTSSVLAVIMLGYLYSSDKTSQSYTQLS